MIARAGAPWRALVVVLLAASLSAAAEERMRVDNGPVPIFEHRFVESRVITTVQPGDPLEVLVRDGDWVRVLTPPDATGTRRAGWIQRALLVNLGPSGGTTKARPAKADGKGVGGEASSGGRATGGAPPPPAGMRAPGGSGLGDWIQPKGLRASVGFNYQGATVAQAPYTLNDRMFGAGATVATSLAVLDPRIVSVEFAGDFQASRATSRASTSSSSNGTGLQSYRLAVGLLTGRSAPFRVYADRVSANNTLESFGAVVDPIRRTRGVHRGAGFTWDIDAGSLLPKFQISGSATRQVDDRDYLYGYGSVSEERRAEVRMTHDYRRGRYDLDFTHASYVYDVPDARIRTDTGNDLLLGTARLMPSGRLTLDANARVSRFNFGVGAARSLVTGAGADGAVRFRMSEHLAAIGRYAFSNNAAEAAISGKMVPGVPGAVPIVASSQLTTRTLFQDGEARLEYSTPRVTMAAIG
ncbi:MAG: hypothetical protein ACM3NQ_09325, partial [Bacteroidales bacterium]